MSYQPSQTVDDAYCKIEEIYESVKGCERTELKKLLDVMIQTEEAADEKMVETVEQIREYVKTQLPPSGETSDEKITFPTVGEFAEEASADTSAHVDFFLYDDDDVDELAEQGLLATHYCTVCKSRKIKPLHMHSHSLPMETMRYIFREVLTPAELKGKMLLDVGSRTGAMLYFASLYHGGSLANITGIELSKAFCEVQKSTVRQFGFKDITIVQGDVFSDEGLRLLASADVLVFNNVFEFFADIQAQRKAWRTVSETVKSGAILITVPSLEAALVKIKMKNTWAKETPLHYPHGAAEATMQVHKYVKN
ncbi:hypothetical protein DIPPA_10388 [Diplonema papillatum]|nr:hypothetical protein DIPPA_10388 [Diplonema papillatum]